jgi:D-xylose transport system ATP-binding protein
LKTLDVKIPSVRSTVASLSGGQRQCIAVAKTILRQPKVVLLDEPTAALGVAQTRQVLNLIQRLKERGLAVVVISHNLHDVFEVTDRIIVMRLGQRIRTFETRNTNPEQVIAAITGVDSKETV